MKGIYIIVFILLLLFGVLSCTKSIPHHHVSFQSKPCIKPLAAFQYVTCGDLKVNIDDHIIIVNKGFRTDLASIPKPLWSFISPMQSGYVYPAILHDFLYAGVFDITRKEADQIFYDALLFEGASGFTANKMWLAVRLFGGRAYKEHEAIE